MEYDTLGVALRTLRCKILGTTDTRRWSDAQSFDTEWEQRSVIVAQAISPNSRVIDFGAGRRTLERYLDRTCTYIPADLASRGNDTIVVDLNTRPLPDLSSVGADVGVLAGVIEYIADVPSFCRWLADQLQTCVVSYGCIEEGASYLQRRRLDWTRMKSGWRNSFTERELLSIFSAEGFMLARRELWVTETGSECIFKLQQDRRDEREV